MSKHMLSFDRPICLLETSVDQVGQATKKIFESVDCADCLRRAISEAEARAEALRDLLSTLEALS